MAEYFRFCKSFCIDLISVFQKFSSFVKSEKVLFSGVSSNSSWTALLSNSPLFPLACILKELSKMIYNSLLAFLWSFASKYGCAKAKIKAVSNNNLVASKSLFLIFELFLDSIVSFFKKRTLVKYSVLNLLNWNKCTKMGTNKRNKKYRISGCLKCILWKVYLVSGLVLFVFLMFTERGFVTF